MIKSLLVDLDDTLIDSHMPQFLPVYFDRLASYLSNLAPAEKVIRGLLEGVQAMTANLDPTQTLLTVFGRVFYPLVGLDETVLRPRLDAFYAQEFPKLRSLTQPKAGADVFVERVLRTDSEFVLATNPLLPLTAIIQRLGWSGVAADADDFALITAIEDWRFAKPRPEYYAEILGRLGRPCAEAAMIGDSFEDDLAPARTLGMQVFHITDHPNGSMPGGSLAEAAAWLDKVRDFNKADLAGPATPLQVLSRLRGYLAALLGMVSGLTAEAWHRKPGPSEWSPLEIVCHLRDVEIEVNQVRLGMILDTPDPFLSAADPDEWAGPRRYQDQEPGQALQAFTHARLETVQRLAALDDAGWARTARHALFGPTSLTEVFSVAGDHDLVHLGQLRACIASS